MNIDAEIKVGELLVVDRPSNYRGQVVSVTKVEERTNGEVSVLFLNGKEGLLFRNELREPTTEEVSDYLKKLHIRLQVHLPFSSLPNDLAQGSVYSIIREDKDALVYKHKWTLGRFVGYEGTTALFKVESNGRLAYIVPSDIIGILDISDLSHTYIS